MILVGFRGITPREAEPTLRNIREGAIGAVVIYDVDAETGGLRNIQSRDQLRELVAAVKAAGPIPPLVTVDAEGGFSHRLREKYGFGPVTPAAEVGERNDLAYTRMNSRAIAETLAEVGIDMNLAPVVDLLNPASLTVSARRRSISADPEIVIVHAREFIKAHRDLGVLTALKHFPGMGGVLRPYSPGKGEVVENWSEAELAPYRRLVPEGMVDAVMTARVTHAQLDPDYPGCLSKKVVQGLLRDEIGYAGVVISETLEMGAIWDVYGFAQGTILAVNAGTDLVLYCNHSGIVPYSDDRAEAAIEVIADAVARGEIAESRVDEACGRILKLKSRLV